MKTRSYIPKICQQCNKQFSARTDASGKFCSRSCAASRLWRDGILTPHGNNPDWRGTPIERFTKFISPEPNSGCWLWTGNANGAGKWIYGTLSVKRKTIRSHRFAWLFFRGPIPVGMDVLHKCDVTLCANPDHLFLGTDLDNQRDMIKKGRDSKRRALIRGSSNYGAKLAEQQILAILSDNRRQKEIASEYGVSKSCIAMIKKKRNWKHIHAMEENVGI